MNFEKIYNECKPILSFKNIYFECNVKPLFEQVLREMSTYKLEAFASLLSRRLQDAISKTNRGLIDIEMIKAVLNYIKDNSHSVNFPFAVKDNKNTLLAPNENYLNCLKNTYSNLAVRLVDEEEIKAWAKNMVNQVKVNLKSLITQENTNIAKLQQARI